MDKDTKHLMALQDLYEITKDYMAYSDSLGAFYKEKLPGDLYRKYYSDCGGVGIGPGWVPIYLNAVNLIEEVIVANPGFRVKILQVKEKFGGLRIYARKWSDGATGGEDDDLVVDDKHEVAAKKVNAIIAYATDWADVVCETCGEQGTLVSPKGWMRVACEKHADK